MRPSALLLAALALPACEFGTRHVKLDALDELTAPSAANGRSLTVHVVDRRREELGATVGHVKDGYDRPTAPIVADRDPRAWFEECLVAHLGHAGFAASRGDAPADLKLDVELFDCDTTAFWTYSAWLRIALTVTRDGTVVVPRTLFEAHAKGEANLGGHASRYEAVLDDATVALLDQVVAVCRQAAHVEVRADALADARATP